MAVKPIPDGYEQAIPYLCINGAAAAIEFYKKAFGATEGVRFPTPDGKVAHAELKVGNAIIMLADESQKMNFRGPNSFGGSPVVIHLYVNDVDAVIARAIALGAKVHRPIANQFYGDRAGSITDPFGHTWHLATHIEDVSPEQMQKRAAALHGKA
jgi:PhnB protein